MQVRIEPPAQRQFEELVDWWRANRPAARDHLEQELSRVLDLLSRQPYIGRPYPERPDVRTHLLRKTPYHVFYAVDDEADTLHVLAVWSAMRGEGPPL